MLELRCRIVVVGLGRSRGWILSGQRCCGVHFPPPGNDRAVVPTGFGMVEGCWLVGLKVVQLFSIVVFRVLQEGRCPQDHGGCFKCCRTCWWCGKGEGCWSCRRRAGLLQAGRWQSCEHLRQCQGQCAEGEHDFAITFWIWVCLVPCCAEERGSSPCRSAISTSSLCALEFFPFLVFF